MKWALGLFLTTMMAVSAANAAAADLTCNGFKWHDRTGGDRTSYQVEIDYRGYDAKPGRPVSVTVNRKIQRVSRPESDWVTVVDGAEGRLQGGVDLATGIRVKFEGGELSAEPYNSGITGLSPQLRGNLTLIVGGDARLTIPVNCPLSRESGEE